MARLLADEQFPRKSVELLRTFGHNVEFWHCHDPIMWFDNGGGIFSDIIGQKENTVPQQPSSLVSRWKR